MKIELEYIHNVYTNILKKLKDQFFPLLIAT